MIGTDKHLTHVPRAPMPTIGMRPAGQAATSNMRALVHDTPTRATTKPVGRTCRSHLVPSAASTDVHGLVLVPVRFQLVASDARDVQDYRLTGSGPLFGEWDIQQAPRLTNVATLPDGGTLWAVQFDLLPDRYTYKVLHAEA